MLFFILILLTIGVGMKVGKEIVSDSSVISKPPVKEQITSSVNPTEALQKKVNLYFVAINDGGDKGKKFGCDDSLVSVEADDSVKTITDAYETLLTIKASMYGNSGLYNSLYQSDLHVNRAEIKKGEANIELVGRYSIAGTCDGPRFVEQLTSVAKQFPDVKTIDITINGQSINDLFSGRGNASSEAVISP